MKRRGPDSLEGLFIAVICCLISTLMYGTAGLSSMLFVACIARYNTDRNRAALPFTLCSVLQAVSGPFGGYLAKKFGVRTVVFAGAVLAPFGIGMCFLAENITVVIVLWGIIFGIGFGLSTLLLPVIITDYFFKQRSKALGLSYLGSPIGFFIFPLIFEVLLNKYGLSGTFLLLSGINMHCLPLCIFLKQANFGFKDENCHLSSGKTADSYSSTDYSTTNQILQTGCRNEENSKTKSNVKTHSKRFSIEFLWNKADSKELMTKQYVLSLNKNGVHENHDILRSFKNYSKNRYENVDTLSKSYQENGCSNYLEINNPSNYQKYELPLTKVAITPAHGKVSKNTDCRSATGQCYEECSTIYFGNCHNFNNAELKKKNQAHFNAAEYMSNGHVKSEITSHSSNKLSSIPTLPTYKKADEFSNSPGDESGAESCIRTGDTDVSNIPSNSVISMYFNPVFILVCIINGIASLHFTTLTTVIIDFSRDLKIDNEYEKYIMMCLSVTGGIGMLGFGWVTDGGYLSRTRFGALSQLIGSISTALLPFTMGFETLIIALSVWCICQASFIPIIPAIIAEYFEEDIQAVAISACYVLCGPLYLIIPPLIGYFRDEKGSYDNIFFLLGCLSFANCIAAFTIPYLARWRSKR